MFFIIFIISFFLLLLIFDKRLVSFSGSESDTLSFIRLITMFFSYYIVLIRLILNVFWILDVFWVSLLSLSIKLSMRDPICLRWLFFPHIASTYVLFELVRADGCALRLLRNHLGFRRHFVLPDQGQVLVKTYLVVIFHHQIPVIQFIINIRHPHFTQCRVCWVLYFNIIQSVAKIVKSVRLVIVDGNKVAINNFIWQVFSLVEAEVVHDIHN